jgi:hypothetical protein
VVFGDTYHVHDFVYVHPSGSGQLLSIGQVVEIKKHKGTIIVEIRFLGRYDEYVREQQKRDTSESDLTFDEVGRISDCFELLNDKYSISLAPFVLYRRYKSRSRPQVRAKVPCSAPN